MSLAYINAKPFVTSNIIGATTLDQLKENIDSINVKLNEKVIEKIREPDENEFFFTAHTNLSLIHI